MNILLVNHYAGSPYHGMGFRPYYLGQEWIKQGHKLYIVAGSYSHIRRKNPDIGDNKYKIENIDGIEYIWLKTRVYKGNGVQRIFSMFDFIIGVYRILPMLIAKQPDVVIASSTYPLDTFPCYKLSKKTGAQYIYEVRDLWPLSPQKLGGYSKYHPFIFTLQLVENFAYKHVDKIVCLLPCAEPYMRAHGLAPGKFYHVPNGVYLPEISNPEPLNDSLKNDLPKNKFIVGYCGTFGVANALDNLIYVADKLKITHPDIFFALVGLGPEKDHLKKLIQEKSLSNIRLYDPIPKSQVQSFLKMCDLLIITWNNVSLYQYGISPNKLFDYMYSRRPIVQAVNAGNDILRDAECGITCDTTPEAISDAIISLRNMPDEERRIMGENGYKYILENHTYEVLSKKFLDAILK